MKFCHTALNNWLYVWEQAYNLLFLSFQKKFCLLELCQSRKKRLQFLPECLKHCKLLPPPHPPFPFLSRFCDTVKSGHKHDSFVRLLQASECSVLRAHLNNVNSLTMHHRSGWKLICFHWLFPSNVPQAIAWNIFSEATEAAIAEKSYWKLEKNMLNTHPSRMQSLLVQGQHILKSFTRFGSKVHASLQDSAEGFLCSKEEYPVPLCLRGHTRTDKRTTGNWWNTFHLTFSFSSSLKSYEIRLSFQ